MSTSSARTTGTNPNEGASSSSSSVLSDKVARGLAVRTDTPAMKAALEALSSSLSASSGSSSSSPEQQLNSRAVRAAMERDALQQALALQTQLEQIVAQVVELRNACSVVARTAAACKNSIHESVVTTETVNSMLFPATSSSTTGSRSNIVSNDESKVVAAAGGDDKEGPEEKLAAVLHSAFLQRDAARQRVHAVNEFLEKFDLSQADTDLLRNYNFTSAIESDGLAFLQALQRTRQIRSALSTSFDDSLGAGSALRMLENLSNTQEAAYERLYQYLQRTLVVQHDNHGDEPEYEDEQDELLQQDFIKRAVYELRHVPAFYSHCIELVAGSRRSETTRRFLLALTAGYAGAAPLELKAHDSVAYVGDMLAFAFRAFSVEADLAKGLLDFKPSEQGHDAEGNKDAATEDAEQGTSHEEDDEQYYNSSCSNAIGSTEMLSIALSGLVRPLKSRILQVIASLARRPEDEENDGGDDSDEDDDDDDDLEHESARTRLTHLYEICGLLLFYCSRVRDSVEKLAGSEEEKNKTSPLLSCLEDCLVEAEAAYEATIRVYAAMLDQMGILTGDSEASIVHDLLIVLADVRMTSPGFSNNVQELLSSSSSHEQQRILSIDWVTETLVTAALTSCKSLDDAVYLKQSLTASKRAGMSITAAEKLDEEIEAKETALIDELVKNETAQVLDLCGLGVLAQAWKSWKEVQDSGQQDLPMASYPGLSQTDVESAIAEFYSSLYSPPLPSLESVKDALIRKTARTKIADNVCEMYAFLYDAITRSAGNGYTDTKFLGHTPEQVNTLFSA